MKKSTKNSIKYACKLWGRIVFATLMCAVLYFSMHMLASALFAQEVGYTVFETDDNGETVTVDTHYYTADEDPSDAVTLLEGQTKQPIKTLTGGGAIAFNVFVQILMLAVLAVFPYDRMWQLGARDENMVQCGRKKADHMRGFKIGLMASTPSALPFVLLLLAKFSIIPGWYMTIYRACNMPYLPFINAFFTVDLTVLDAPWFAFVAAAITIFFVPAICALGYWLGRIGFSLRDHVVYKQKKENNA